jgi:hypothetical protein
MWVLISLAVTRPFVSICREKSCARRSAPSWTEIEAREFAESHSVETMAEFQGLLLALEQESTILEIASICD